MRGGILVPVVVTTLLVTIAVDAQAITLSSPTQTSDGQFINVTVTGERRTRSTWRTPSICKTSLLFYMTCNTSKISSAASSVQLRLRTMHPLRVAHLIL